MNTKKIVRILYVIVIAMVIITMTSTVFAADEATGYDPSDYDGSDSKIDVAGIQGIGQSIIKIITTVGSLASVIVLVVLGLKYMMGSAEEKAEYKKTLIPYVIGAALVFAASAIAGVVYTFTQNLGT